MALDIKRGRQPFQSFERPEKENRRFYYAKRYFSKILRSITRILSLASVFLVFIWIFGFQNTGPFAGSLFFNRIFLWQFLSVLLFVLWIINSFLLPNKISRPKIKIIAILSPILLFSFISSLASSNPFLSFGLIGNDSGMSFPIILLGIFWIFFISSSWLLDSGFLKAILVSYLLGSAILVLYIIISWLFAGKYESLLWVQQEGWLLIFSVNVFLLIGFAMFQKGISKSIWSFSIVLHIIALFLWDSAASWIALLFGISFLLVFQILYSKNLWQKNFTYPLQIWIICFVLLLAPIKMFTGSSAPLVLKYDFDNFNLSAKAGVKLFFLGNGPGSAFEYASDSLVSSFDPLKDDIFSINKHVSVYAPDFIELELGFIGVILFLFLLILFFWSGIKFLRQNLESFKEHALSKGGSSMSEATYLGTISFLGFLILVAGSFFMPYSFVVWWLLILLFSLFAAFYGPGEFFESGQIESGQKDGKRNALIPIISVLVLALLWFGYLQIRSFMSQSIARQAFYSNDPQRALELWEQARSMNLFNNIYSVQAAKSEVLSLSDDSPIDVQRAALLRATSEISKITRSPHGAIVDWIAAESYKSMQKYAEGSSALARSSYLSAILKWPKNLALPVEISRFYREYMDSLVSGDLSADNLRQEAKSYLNSALALEPGYLPARLELSFIIEQERGTMAAIAALEPYENNSPEIMYNIGRMYFNEKNFSVAAEKFSKAIKQLPSHSNARYSLAIAYFRLGRFDESLKEFEEVLRLNPGNQDVEEKIKQVKKKIGE